MKLNNLATASVIMGFLFIHAVTAPAQINWAASGSPHTWWESVAASTDGTRMIASAYGDNIYLSTDSGQTWTPSPTGALNGYAWYAVASSADGTNLMAAGLFVEGIYLSTNAGASWYLSAAPNGNWFDVYCSANGKKLVASTSAASGQIYYSTNGGATWPAATAPSGYWRGLAGTPDGTTLWAGDSFGGRIYKSTDSGQTWTILSGSPQDYWSKIVCSTNGQTVVAASYGGSNPAHIYISTNSGANWFISGAPMGIWWGLVCSADGTKMVAASQDIGIWNSTDSGITWVQDNARTDVTWAGLAGSADCSKLVATAINDSVYINVPATAPILAIAGSGTNVVLTWTTNAAGFRLVANTGLTTTNWQTVTNPINIVLDQNQVTVPATGAASFFRLQNP